MYIKDFKIKIYLFIYSKKTSRDLMHIKNSEKDFTFTLKKVKEYISMFPKETLLLLQK